MTTINLANYFNFGEIWLIETIKDLKQDVFPIDYRIIFEYNKDIFVNTTDPGKIFTKTVNLLSDYDIPFYFVEIKTSYDRANEDSVKLRQIFANYESNLTITKSTVKFEKIIQNKKSFCIMPWIHFYVNQQGQVGGCCMFDEKHSLGNIENADLTELHNLPKLKQLRLQLLNDERPMHCKNCWDREDHGLKSARIGFNKKFEKHQHLVNDTTLDGSVNNFKLLYADLRDNNLCNLKCRMCSGKYSSSIAQEEYQIWGDKKYIELSNVKSNTDKIVNYLTDNVQYLEEIYFAGGEPLLLDSHYKILDLLIEKNPNCNIRYNTNLTTLQYKNKKVINYWKLLSNVDILASIDLTGSKANYVRHGSNYEQIKKNYFLIKDIVNFKISSVLSLYNIFNLPLLQKEWIELGVKPKNIGFNILTSPSYMDITVLPKSYKNNAIKHIESHIQYLKSTEGAENIISNWQEVVAYITSTDRSILLKDFFELNDIKDKHRKESFEEIFPEYRQLREYH